MHISFDKAKDSRNQKQHGISLAEAEALEWDDAWVWVDERFSYDELRMNGLVPGGMFLYYVAFVDSGEVRRVISMRKATRKEISSYVAKF